jgi:hypothetical protein
MLSTFHLHVYMLDGRLPYLESGMEWNAVLLRIRSQGALLLLQRTVPVTYSTFEGEYGVLPNDCRSLFGLVHRVDTVQTE